ncbi:MAG: CapA family protein [Aeromicrobium sp.]|uniref:CapA family protein n=1 Tax=Aeromicrobium sp. TaxID=1871063 RepID=UPI0039E632A5
MLSPLFVRIALALAIVVLTAFFVGGAPGGGAGPVPPASASTARNPAAPAEPASVVIGASGEILPHAPVIRSAHQLAGNRSGAYDFAPLFAEVAPLLSAPQLSLCHLEAPISDDPLDIDRPAGMVFNSPPQLAAALAGAGFDGCEFASNHTLDQGMSGLRDTQAVVEGAGMTYAGPSADAARSGQPAMLRAGDLTIAHLAYSYTAFNDSTEPNARVPEAAPWLSGTLWAAVGAAGIAGDAERAREAGADLVVVSLHWGVEYQAEPTGDQREVARELLEAGAVDLILGTHAHVVQPCEKINDRYVLYGMGNFLSNQSPSAGLPVPTQDGMIAQVTLALDADGALTSSLAVQPAQVQIPGHRIQLATPQRNAASYQRTMDTLGSLGTCDVTSLAAA